jgi:hypothetical protein
MLEATPQCRIAFSLTLEIRGSWTPIELVEFKRPRRHRADGSTCPSWVKSGKARNEHDMCGLLPKAELQSEQLDEYTP